MFNRNVTLGCSDQPDDDEDQLEWVELLGTVAGRFVGSRAEPAHFARLGSIT